MNNAAAIARIKEIMTRRRAHQSKIGYLNAHGQYGLTEPVITSRTVTFTCDFSRVQVPTKLPRGFLSMEGRHAVSKPAIARVTATHGLIVSPTSTLGMVNHWFIKTTSGFAIIHRSGSAQITSAKAVGRVAQQLEHVIKGLTNARIVKFDARMSIGRLLKLDTIGRYFPNSLGTWLYEPELMNRAEVKWNSPSMKLIFYVSGQVQIFGASKPKEAMSVVRRIIDHVTPERMFKQSREGGYAVSSREPESRNTKRTKNKMSKLNSRHPLVANYNVVPEPGQYVRPGPNGKPRLYNVKGNMTLSLKKIQTAYQKAGVTMPQYLQNMFGSTFVWYGAPKAADRAASWNAKKNGYYVAPGPGKQPHFYKVPKDLKAGFLTAKVRYEKASMNIPSHVRTIFGVPANSPIRTRPRNHVVQNTKVNGKSYKKLTTNQLVTIARNLGDAGATSKLSKNALFERIKSRGTIKKASPVRAPDVTVKERVYIFSNDPTNQRIVRNGYKRVFSTLPKPEREEIAKAYLGNNYTTIQPKNWYNAMRAKKMFTP